MSEIHSTQLAFHFGKVIANDPAVFVMATDKAVTIEFWQKSLTIDCYISRLNSLLNGTTRPILLCGGSVERSIANAVNELPQTPSAPRKAQHINFFDKPKNDWYYNLGTELVHKFLETHAANKVKVCGVDEVNMPSCTHCDNGLRFNSLTMESWLFPAAAAWYQAIEGALVHAQTKAHGYWW